MSIVSLGFALTSYVFAGAYLALHLLFSLYGVWLLEKIRFEHAGASYLADTHTHTHTKKPAPVRDLAGGRPLRRVVCGLYIFF